MNAKSLADTGVRFVRLARNGELSDVYARWGTLVVAVAEAEPMKIYRPDDVVADRAWGAIEVDRLTDATVRLHWSNEPYIWHVNDGPEIFVVLAGTVNMYTRGPSGEDVHRLSPGDVFHAGEGDEHKAEPLGEAKILVVERAGSI